MYIKLDFTFYFFCFDFLGEVLWMVQGVLSKIHIFDNYWWDQSVSWPRNATVILTEMSGQVCKKCQEDRWQLNVSRWKRGIDSRVLGFYRTCASRACQQQAEVTVLWLTRDTEMLCLDPLASFPYSFSPSWSHSLLFHTPVGQESSIFNHFLFSSQNFILFLSFNPS